MGSRALVAAVVLALVPAAAATAASAKPASWAASEIRTVTAAGLFDAATPSSFRPNDQLTAQTLQDVIFDLQQQAAAPLDPGVGVAPYLDPQPPTTTTTTMTTPTTTTPPPPTTAPKPLADPEAPVTMAQLDARLVKGLDLSATASVFAQSARDAGLKVPSRFGTEVVARLLGLRLNHPAAQDSLELLPGDPATRAEAAYSVAQILGFDGSQVENVESLASEFALPELTDWQKAILTTAVARIGMPYIWGGTSDHTETEFGVTSRGGYDCSGFVWRVYKLQAYPGEGGLASVLKGRTTYQMSGEVPRSKRIGLAALEPADVIFFGDKGPKSQPSQVGHMGIYLGNGWFIHSSDYGVAIARLDGWYARTFAWARRPLAEAGLES